MRNMGTTVNIYWDGFRTFLKIGCFTFGGGYAMIPLIEEEIVKKRAWLEEEEFLDLIALSQTMPGVFAVNTSIAIGHRLKGFWGSLLFALGTIIPSFIIILLIAMFFTYIKENHFIQALFKGMRPAVVALIAAPCFRLARTAHITLQNIWLPLGTILAVWLMRLSPIYVIAAVAIGGFLYGKIILLAKDESIRKH